MSVTSNSTTPNLDRRTALSSAAVIAATFGLGGQSRVAARQEEDARHACVGAWLIYAPANAFGTITFTADGIVTQGFMPNYVDPDLGVTFQSFGQGTWEAVDERQVHFTAIHSLVAPDGTFLGTGLIEGWPVVSEDGQSIEDHDLKGRFVRRDATNAVVMDASDFDAGVLGIRITPGSLTSPEDVPLATPTS
jgi:hypothetical protein